MKRRDAAQEFVPSTKLYLASGLECRQTVNGTSHLSNHGSSCICVITSVYRMGEGFLESQCLNCPPALTGFYIPTLLEVFPWRVNW